MRWRGAERGDIEAYENVLQMVEAAVKGGLKEYEETNGKSWEEELAQDERLKEVKKDDLPKTNEKTNTETEERYESSLRSGQEMQEAMVGCATLR